LTQEEGILSGISCGAAAARRGPNRQACREQRQNNRGYPSDSGERYLSSILFEGLFDATGLAAERPPM